MALATLLLDAAKGALAVRLALQFGPDIANMVEGVTKLGQIPWQATGVRPGTENIQAENLRKMFIAMARDWRVLLIKLADRLHNMRTLHHLSEDRRLRIAQETREIYAPIAHRLGMGKIRAELEDLSFQYLEPEAAAELNREFDSIETDELDALKD